MLRWSMPCGRVLGIAIRIHFSFLLLLIWVAWLGWQLGGGPWASLWALALVLCLFGCVVLHELGHSVVAIRFGVHVESITLLPIGGVAGMRAIPEKPIQEFLIALAGPLVNVIIVMLLVTLRRGFPLWSELPGLPSNLSQLSGLLILTNIILVVFNLVPAFPMDGGRILRSVLAMKLPYVTATDVAVILGQAFGVLFIVVGIWQNPLLAVIGLFVIFGAKSEQQRVRMRARLKDIRAGEIMVTNFTRLRPDDTLARCLEYVGRDRQEHFPVVEDERLVGLLPRREWLAALRREGAATPVGIVMKRRFLSVYPGSKLSGMYSELLATRQEVFPVVEGSRVLGLLVLDDIARYLAAQPARGQSAWRPAARGGAPRKTLTIDLG